jgi:hypothetical protein
VAGFLGYEATKGWTPGKLKRTVNAALPTGSTRAQVQAWLDSQGFPNGPDTPDKGGRWLAEEASVDPHRVKVQISAGVPDTNADWGDLGRSRIRSLTFCFAEEDRLVGHILLVRPEVERR